MAGIGGASVRAAGSIPATRRANHLRSRFSCPAPFAKIFWFSEMANQVMVPPSRPTEGRLAIVTDAGRDAMAASGASDERR
jgi:hypothetical protein